MSGRLPDTNAVAALFNQDEALYRMLAGTTLLIPCHVVGELYFGAFKSGRPEHNLNRLEQFLETNEVLNCDTVTAKHYGR
jgi:tRNA(fMet)-specific endonuclease VapC